VKSQDEEDTKIPLIRSSREGVSGLTHLVADVEGKAERSPKKKPSGRTKGELQTRRTLV